MSRTPIPMTPERGLFPFEAVASRAPDALAATSPSRLSPKQRAILEYLSLRVDHRITLAQATELVGGDIYHNAAKYTGALLANMIRRGLIVRVGKGVFALPSTIA